MEFLTKGPKQSLNTVIESAAKIHAARCDSIEPLGCIEVLPSKTMCLPALGKSMPVSDWALSQVCGKLGLPSLYIDRCFSRNAGVLGSANINYWIRRRAQEAERPPQVFVRTHDGTVDGFLSTRYTPFDSDRILDVLSCEMGKTLERDYTLRGSYISDERLHLRFVENGKIFPGDDLFGAVFIDSSDVGRKMLSISYGIWKQVCTNGLIICQGGGTLFMQRHISITAEEFADGLRKAVASIPEIRQQAIDAIAAAKGSKVNFSDVDKLAEMIRKRIDVDRKTADNVIRLAMTRYDTSKWGLVNAITEQAQAFTLDERIRLERAAGQLLAA